MPDNGVPDNGVHDNYALDPAMPVLLRPDGTVQVGWDPRRAVRVHPPDGLSAGGLAAVLRSLPTTDTVRLAVRHGLRDRAGFEAMLADLAGAGALRAVAAPGRRASGRTLSIRVCGSGPLADLLMEGLRCSGARVGHSGQTAGVPAGVDLMVLTDYLAAEPRLLRECHTSRVAHLPVRVRDGTGLVGPLVIPGVTSCLVCVDLHRTDRDPAWPALAAQLREVVGVADRPTLLATAALALDQLRQVISGVRSAGSPPAPPATLDTTFEVDVSSPSISARRWPRHPLCGCWRRHG